MPALVGNEDKGRIRLELGHRDGFIQNDFLYRLSFAVMRVEAKGEFACTFWIGSGQYIYTKRAASDPATRINARTERKAQMPVRKRWHYPCDFSKRRQAWPVKLC